CSRARRVEIFQHSRTGRASQRAIDRLSVRQRRCLLAISDAAAWPVGLTVGIVLRFNLSFHIPRPFGLAVTAAIAAVTQLLIVTMNGVYRGRWLMAGLEGAR